MYSLDYLGEIRSVVDHFQRVNGDSPVACDRRSPSGGDPVAPMFLRYDFMVTAVKIVRVGGG